MFHGLVVAGIGLALVCISGMASANAPVQKSSFSILTSSSSGGPSREETRNLQLVRNDSQKVRGPVAEKKRHSKNQSQKTAKNKASEVEQVSSDPERMRLEGQDQARTFGQQAKTIPSAQPEEVLENSQSALQQSQGLDGQINYMEIEVSKSKYTFKLFANMPDGNQKTLYDCHIGLGGSEFPTPVGEYYVTHIYDDKPWWIPPKNRAWAAGDSPSQRVYGGTMAPLLKKRPVRVKKQALSQELEDKIAGPVRLDDDGYRFHGTNQPRSIRRNQSHGCVRMLPADAAKVASLIKEYVGMQERKESENGSFVVLKAPVRLNLVQ